MNERMRKIAIGVGGAAVLIIVIVLLYNIFSGPSCKLSTDKPGEVKLEDLKAINGDKTLVLYSGYLRVKNNEDKEPKDTYLNTKLNKVSKKDNIISVDATCMTLEIEAVTENTKVTVKSLKVKPVGISDITECTLDAGDAAKFSYDKDKKAYVCNDLKEYKCKVANKDKLDVGLALTNFEYAVDTEEKEFPKDIPKTCT